MTNIHLNPDAEITDKSVYGSGFIWRPKIVKTFDYEKVKQNYSLENSHLFILCGVSTAGKDTLLHKALGKVPNVINVPRVTSRPKRPGEIDGVHYFFGIEESIIWSTYADNTYGVPSRIFSLLSEKKKVVTTNGLVYAPTLKDMFEKLGVKVTILYILPGKISDSLENLKQTVVERLFLRDEQDERAKSAIRELTNVIQYKEYLQKIGTIFIENEPNDVGYSPKALDQLVNLLSAE